MSFNGSGTWVPPAGQPVASGTVIQSTTHNTLVTDIGNSFNNTLPRDGQAPMQGQLKITDGTSSIPGIGFNSEASTGMFRPTPGVLGLSVSGVEGLRLNSAGRIVIGSTDDDGTNKLQVNGPAKVTGTATLASTLNVAGATSLSTLNTSGAATLGSTLNVTGAVTAASFNGPLTGNVTGNVTGNASGNAGSATKLQIARSINGVAFDGSADVTVADSTKLPLTGHVGMLNGGTSVDISNTSLNGATKAGFYRGKAMTGAPDTGWWYVLVESHDATAEGAAGWSKQTVTAYGSENSYPPGTIFVRVRSGTAAWGTWLRQGGANGDTTLDFSARTLASASTVAASGGGGFLSTTYASNARNPIWRFGNADGYGLSYFQGSSGIGSQDTIGLHFGTPTALAAPFAFRQDGTAWFGNSLNVNQGGLLLDAGGNLNFKAKAGTTDAGDAVWLDETGAEQHRLWSDFAQSSLLYRYKGGTAYKLWHEGNLNPSESADPSSIVRRTTNGYINGNYIWMSDDGNPGGNPNPVSAVITKRGDNYYRSSDALSVKNFLGLRNLTVKQIGASEDLNAYYATPGFFGMAGHPVNSPIGDGQLLVMGSPDKDTTGMIAMPYSSSDAYIRSANNYGANWNPWTRVLTESNPTVWRSYVSRVPDNGVVLETFNTTATSQPRQFYITHSLADAIIGNDRGELYMNGAAYRLRLGTGQVSTFNWQGQSYQPTWLWGGNDASSMNVYNPLNFDVSTAWRLRTDRTNYSGATDGNVVGQLMWKNFGNNHTIFDASNGTSPTGAAIDKTNAQIAWGLNYPTLMGWNGSNTYGVRVDSARWADGAGSANVLNGAAHTNGSDGWFRSSGNCGLYNETYDTGIYATQWHQVRTYNGTSFYSEGDLSAAGNVGAYSDERLKTNWRDVKPNFVKRLAKVKSGVYDRTDVTLTQAGVSAQSWRRLLPQTVMKDKQGMLSVNYGAAALVSSVELAKEVVQLKQDLTKAMKLIEKLTKKLGGV